MELSAGLITRNTREGAPSARGSLVAVSGLDEKSSVPRGGAEQVESEQRSSRGGKTQFEDVGREWGGSAKKTKGNQACLGAETSFEQIKEGNEYEEKRVAVRIDGRRCMFYGRRKSRASRCNW